MGEARVSGSTIAAFASMVALVLMADVGGFVYALRMLDHGLIVAVLHGATFAVAVVSAGLAVALVAFTTGESHQPLRATVSHG